MKKLGIVILLCGLALSWSISFAQSWSSWVAEVRQQAISEGIEARLFDQIFSTIQQPSHQVKSFHRSQPEKRLTFLKYRNTRADKFRVNLGRQEYKKHQALLENIGKQYGVDPCVVTSIWGLETSYGRYMGDFPVVKSLATLAYDSDRKAFFRDQLFLALHIVNDGHVDLNHFKGEWAGASGHPQFLPSSWYNYAVDYTGDGRKDIWTTLPDALASIANYLKENGWQANEPWAIEVRLPNDFDMALEGKENMMPIANWDAMGVRTLDGQHLPLQSSQAAIVKPYGGPAFLAFKNFSTIMTYNKSTYYAGTVGWMADQICHR